MKTLSLVAFLVLLVVGAFDATRAASSSSSPPTFTVIPLPFAEDALEPAISNRTVSFHYGKHLPAYVANLNAALKNSSEKNANETLSAVIKSVGGEGGKNGGKLSPTATAIRDNGGGAWNHFLYFNQLRPHGNGSSELPKELKKEIDLSFGSFEEMYKKLEAASLSVFGSGWAWLVWTGDKAKPLAVETTPDQDNPLMKKLGYSGHVPVLGIDVWEHSYYLDYQNVRAKYVEAVLGDGKDPSTGIIDWGQVEKNLEAAEKGDTEEAIKPRVAANSTKA